MKLTIKDANLQQVMIKSKEFICFPKLWVCTREQYVYGYAFYEITAAASPFDLPLFFLKLRLSAMIVL